MTILELSWDKIVDRQLWKKKINKKTVVLVEFEIVNTNMEL